LQQADTGVPTLITGARPFGRIATIWPVNVESVGREKAQRCPGGKGTVRSGGRIFGAPHKVGTGGRKCHGNGGGLRAINRGATVGANEGDCPIELSSKDRH